MKTIFNRSHALFIVLLGAVFLLQTADVQSQQMPSFRTRPNKNTYEERYISYMAKQEKEEAKARQKYEKELKKAEETKRKDDIRKLKKELSEKNKELVLEKKAKKNDEKKLNKEIAELKKRLEKIEGKPATKSGKDGTEVVEQVVDEGNTVEQVQLVDEAPLEPQPQATPPAEPGRDDFFNEIQPETENEPVIVTSNEEVLGEKKQPSNTFLGKLKRALW